MTDDKSRARLGRGLASLIGGGGTAGEGGPRASLPFGGGAGTGERKLDMARLVANPKNPRRTFAPDDLAELTASIRTHGIVQPILVRRREGDGGLYEIVAGERRWRAARAAGLSEVPVVVREINDRESLEIAIIENVQRADLNAIEEGRGYQALIDEHGYTQADLADILGKSRSHVANTLRLLKLPEAVQEMVMLGELSPGAARTAVSVEDPEGFARWIVEGGMSVRDAEEAARGGGLAGADEAIPARPRGKKARAATAAKDSDTQALERLLAETLSMPVSIDLKGTGGRLSLDFSDLDQLDELCRLLQARHRRTSEAEPRVRSL